MKPKFNLNITIMKTLQKTTVLFLLALLMTSFSTSQVVVAEKLNAPETNIQNISNRTQYGLVENGSFQTTSMFGTLVPGLTKGLVIYFYLAIGNKLKVDGFGFLDHGNQLE